MSRYTDVDALIERVMGNGLRPITEQIFRKLVEDAPSIDLVRCAECKKVREDGGHANCGGYLYCRKWKTLVDEDQFCSWGERRE